jgi:hypothetical protein
MKCISCEMEINTKWKHAVDTNVCPFCGMGIMPEELKELFSSLRKVMDDLQQFPDQLNDWMLANHAYVKIDSPLLSRKSELVEDKENKKFIVKVATEKGEEEVVAEKIQSEARTNEFFKRAEAVKPGIDGFKSTEEKTKHLKEMVKQIKRGGGADLRITSDDSESSVDSVDVTEMQSLISDGDLISSSLPDMSDGVEDEVPSFVLNMANQAKGGSKDPHADLAKLQQRISDSRKNFKSGAKGSFSRA